MRFNRSLKNVKLYFISFVLLFSFFATLMSPKETEALGEPVTTCIGSKPSVNVQLHPKAVINVKLASLNVGVKTLPITLKDSSQSVVLYTNNTCDPESDGDMGVTYRTAFSEIPEGSYFVCYQEKCTAVSIAAPIRDRYADKTVTIPLQVSDIAPELLQNIYVVVRIKTATQTADKTYGPTRVVLSEFEAKDHADGEVAANVTGETTIVKNTPPGELKLYLTIPAGPGKYKVCLTGDLKNCSVKFNKVALANYTAYIDVTEAQSVKLITKSSNADPPKTCGSEIAGIGWIVCPVINFVISLNDSAYGTIKGMLTVNPISQKDENNKDTAIYTAWGSIRSIANVLFVIFFLIIIFSQLSNIGISNYGVKKILPRLIICAILVNISFVVVQVVVDLANITGSGLYNLIAGAAPAISVSWSEMWLMLFTNWVVAPAATVGAVAIIGGSATVLYTILPMAIMGLFGLFASLLTLIFRQAVIPLLAILAPLAFVAYLLPNTESWFKKWRSALTSMLMMYPIAAVVFGGSQFAAAIIIGDKSSSWNFLIGMVILTVPLFSIPFISRQGGSILTKVGGALNKLAENARAPLKEWSKGHADEKRAEYRADTKDPGWLRRQANKNKYTKGLYDSPRNFNAASATRRDRRADNATAANDEFKTKGISDEGVKGVFGKKVQGRQEAYDRANAAKQHAGIDSVDSNKRVRDNNPELNQRKYGSDLAEKKSVADNTTRLMSDHSFDGARIAVETATGVSETATAQAETIVENDPGVLQVRAAKTAASGVLETAKENIKGIIEEASTDTTSPGAPATLSPEAMSIDSTVRDQLKSNKIEQKIATSRTSAATGVQNQEIADVFATIDPTTHKPGDAAMRAGGIAGEAGAARVQASAISAQESFRGENVKAQATLFTAAGYGSSDDGELMAVVEKGELKGGGTATPEQREAALQLLGETGNVKSYRKLSEYVTKLASTGDPEALPMQQALRRVALSSGKKPKSFGGTIIGKLFAGSLTDDFDTILLTALDKGKVSSEDFAKIDNDELDFMAKALAVDGKGGKKQILSDDSRINLAVLIDDALKDDRINNAITDEQRTPLMELRALLP